MKAYIFDMDGTLLDSLGVWEQIDIDFLKKRGLIPPPHFAADLAALSFRETAEYVIKRFGLADSPGQLMEEWHNMAVYAYGNTVRLKPYAKEYLHRLLAKGAKLAVATSLPKELYGPALRGNGIESIFHAICSTDEVPRGKTHPDVFQLAAARLEVKPADCVVFEDVPPAIRSARSIGMTAYGVYDPTSEAYWEEVKQAANGVIYSWSEAPTDGRL